MKIYFEDGRLLYTSDVPEFNFIVDAGLGAKNNLNALELYHKIVPDCTVYTNSLLALHNLYCWNSKIGAPELYLRAGAKQAFTRVDSLTHRELREGHNLMKMYLSGEFKTV